MRTNKRLKRVVAPLAVVSALVLAGCTDEQKRGFLPGTPGGEVTNHTESVTALWTTSWIVLLGVGALVWGLVLWTTIMHRRRKGQTGYPVQLRYNMPIEALFTVIPIIMIVAFFAFTAKTMTEIERPTPNPQTKIQVIGKRWSWDFNYTQEGVHYSGKQTIIDDQGKAVDGTLPVLYMPVNKTTEIQLDARDVIHSFWVIDFLYKKDMIPGKTNYMYFTPTKVGTYRGKCAELCGEYHSNMLFEVKVVEQAEYDAYIAKLKSDPKTQGLLDANYNPNQNVPNNKPLPEHEGEHQHQH